MLVFPELDLERIYPGDFISLIISCCTCCQTTDSNIQKLKQHYNQSGGPALEVTLAEVQEDLKLHPPQVITLEEVELSNGTANGHMEQAAGSGKID